LLSLPDEAVTTKHGAQLDAAIAALPPARRLNPTENVLPRIAKIFANSFAKGIESLLA
jgi:hypothetical protein